jgi:hypothetical protein
MTKLKKAVKKKWVAALRSGKYEQGKTALSIGGKYCCLGVLCEVAIENGLPIQATKSAGGLTEYDDSVSYLPHSVFDWATLKKGRGCLVDFHVPSGCLSQLNDSGKSFEEIADMIEEYL